VYLFLIFHRLYQPHVLILHCYEERSQNFEKRLLSSSCLSARRPSARMKRLGSHWRDFHEIWHLSILRKYVEKFSKFQQNLTRITGTLHEGLRKLMISRLIIARMLNISDRSCRENENTHFMFSTFFRKLCLLWNNVEKYGRAWQATDGNIIWRMRFAYWITKARTQTHTANI
jgi:hypothetical protein